MFFGKDYFIVVTIDGHERKIMSDDFLQYIKEQGYEYIVRPFADSEFDDFMRPLEEGEKRSEIKNDRVAYKNAFDKLIAEGVKFTRIVMKRDDSERFFGIDGMDKPNENTILEKIIIGLLEDKKKHGEIQGFSIARPR